MSPNLSSWLWPNGGTTSPPFPGKVAKGFRSTSEYGARTPILTPLGWTSNFHTGIDLVGFSTIRAVHAGTVTFAGDAKSDGVSVRIDHGDGLSSESIHMVPGSLQVAKGATVAAGQALGAVGKSGMAVGTHLHFRVKVNGRITDPRPFLEARVNGGGGAGGGTTPEPERKGDTMSGIRFQNGAEVMHDYIRDGARLRRVSDPEVLNQMYQGRGSVTFYDLSQPGAKTVEYTMNALTGITPAELYALGTDGEWVSPWARQQQPAAAIDYDRIIDGVAARFPKFPTKLTIDPPPSTGALS